MSDISLSKAVRSNLLSLQNTAALMGTTQNRLATGNKVNSALDNPTNFFTASSLNSRAGDLNALMDSMANGIQTLEAANNGLTSITKTLESMQSTLRQARQDKTFLTQSLDLGSIDPNLTPAKQFSLSGGAIGNPTNIDLTVTGTGQTSMTSANYTTPPVAAAASLVAGSGVAVQTTTTAQAAFHFTVTFGGKTAEINLPADTARNTTAALATAINAAIGDTDLGGKITATQAGGAFTLTGPGSTDGTIVATNGTTASAGGTDATALFGDPASGTAANRPVSSNGSNGTYDLTINGKTVQLTATESTAALAITKINATLGTASKFEAYAGSGSKIGIRAKTADAGPLTIGGVDASLFSTPADTSGLKFQATVSQLVDKLNTDFSGKLRASNDNGRLRLENLSTQDLTIGGKNASGGALDGSTGTGTSSTIAGNSVRSDLAKQYNELRDQLDKTSDDASFNGVNLLRGDKLKITFNETGTSTIDIQTKGNAALNSASLKLTDLIPKDLDSDTNIDALIDSVKTSLSTVRSQSSVFGSNLSIVQNRQDFTKNMINTLQTGAANLTLADSNEEAANLLALQTRQSLSQQSLSLASQADQSVLQLLR